MYADLHCDTLYKCYTTGRDLSSEDFHINLENSKNIRPYIQTFAHYIPETKNKFEYLCDFLHNSLDIIDNTDEILLYTKPCDITLAETQNKILAVLSIEGGDIFTDDDSVNRDRVRFVAENNFKFISLCYNKGSAVCGGADCPPEHRLTDKGRKIVYDLASRGITIDVSHLNHTSTKDILDMDVNVAATHSLCFDLCDNRRNILTENLVRIIEKGGLVGVNIVPFFLTKEKIATIDHLVKHIEYIRSLGGENTVCFGADFDGIDTTPKGINNVGDIIKLREYIENPDGLFYNNIKNYLFKNT